MSGFFRGKIWEMCVYLNTKQIKRVWEEKGIYTWSWKCVIWAHVSHQCSFFSQSLFKLTQQSSYIGYSSKVFPNQLAPPLQHRLILEGGGTPGKRGAAPAPPGCEQVCRASRLCRIKYSRDRCGMLNIKKPTKPETPFQISSEGCYQVPSWF